MLKFNYLTALALGATVALSSCTSDEVLDTQESTKAAISFSTFVDKTTRAEYPSSATTVPNMKTNTNGFGVFGLMKAGSNPASISFKDQTVTWDNDASKWTYSPTQYWEEGYKYKFLAVYPHAGNNVGAVVETYLPTWESWGELSFQGLIGTGDYVLAIDETHATTPIGSKTDQPTIAAISFSFKHVLMKVRFAFKNVMEDHSTLSIRSLKIKSYYSGAKLKIASPVENSEWLEAGATLNNTALDFNNPLNKDADDTATEVVKQQIGYNQIGYSDSKFLIPLKKTGETPVEYSIQFVITRTLPGGAMMTYNKNATIALKAGEEWKLGYAYTFTADLDMKAVTGDEQRPIEFTADQVEPWGNENTGSVSDLHEVNSGEISQIDN